MNARTCQLCGKPLSRLRVGGDGDFCSREHRTQHRLRLGMDRLEEANKVTSLMRRRENPRHISAARLMCNSAQERRGFFEPKQAAPQDRHFRFYPGPARSRRSPCLWRRRPVCGATRRAALRPRLLPPCGRLPDPHQRSRYRALQFHLAVRNCWYRSPRRRWFCCVAIRRRQGLRRAISECCAAAKFAFTWVKPRSRRRPLNCDARSRCNS